MSCVSCFVYMARVLFFLFVLPITHIFFSHSYRFQLLLLWMRFALSFNIAHLSLSSFTTRKASWKPFLLEKNNYLSLKKNFSALRKFKFACLSHHEQIWYMYCTVCTIYFINLYVTTLPVKHFGHAAHTVRTAQFGVAVSDSSRAHVYWKFNLKEKIRKVSSIWKNPPLQFQTNYTCYITVPTLYCTWVKLSSMLL